MNFKTLTLISLLVFAFSSCGVKGPPTYKKGTELQSYPEKFLKNSSSTEQKSESEEEKKEDQQKN